MSVDDSRMNPLEKGDNEIQGEERATIEQTKEQIQAKATKGKEHLIPRQLEVHLHVL